MYRYSPIRNQRSKGIKTKHVVQLCLLVAVCFWLIFQVKRSHDKKKEFDANISLNTRAAEADHETVKFGRKDLQPKLEETTTRIEDAQEDEDDQDENKHEDEDKTEEEKDDGGGGGDDEIDEKSNVEIDRDEVDIIDEDKETEEGEEKDGQSQTENTVEQEKSNMEFDRDEVDIVDEDDKVNEESEEKDGQSQTENTVEQEKSNIEIDHDEVDIVDEDKTSEESEGKDGQSQTENRVEDVSTEHTHEAREEHYKADDASSAVLTRDPENEIKNGTLIENRSSPNTTTTHVTETTPNLTQMLNAEENTSEESRHLDN
ncbi:uncharacterized protein LOC143579915 isoform X1 [Bidens hawaiensis]|uniref:uncharacterized protein LOC143579915 isoform X1 n=1 Tax=Bidens hawaiensis TaxID=980011 RepID=UPI00404A89C6